MQKEVNKEINAGTALDLWHRQVDSSRRVVEGSIRRGAYSFELVFGFI